MVNKKINFNFIILLGAAAFFFSASTVFAVTYNVSSCADLQAVDAAAPYDSADIVELNADISCDTVLGDVSDFNATFDGNGNTVTLTGDTALFGTLNGATVQDLIVTGDIDGGGLAYISALANTATNGTLIDRVGVTANITNASSYSAGFVYMLEDSTVRDSYHTGTVTTTGSYTSGVAAFVRGGSIIERIYSTGTISGASYIGGIAGLLDRVGSPQIIRDSFFAGTITSSNSLAGAIAGLIDDFLTPDESEWLSNNYYDADSVDPDVCAQSTPNVTDTEGVCEAVNTDASPDPDYFNDNNTNPPFDTWDFDTVWSVNTTGPLFEDISDPTVSTLSPADDASDIDVDTNLAITFNEVVDAESGNITLKKTSDDSNVEIFDVTSDISGTGTTVITINPTSNLDYETSYYVEIDATAFDDAAGNSYAGIADTTTWNFTTETEPVRTSSSSSSVVYGCKDVRAENYKAFSRHDQSLCTYGDQVEVSEKEEVVQEGGGHMLDNQEVVVKEILDITALAGVWLMEGDSGDLVVLLQKALNTTGANLIADGVFGRLTEEALRNFQDEGGLDVDGILGPNTYAKLINN